MQFLVFSRWNGVWVANGRQYLEGSPGGALHVKDFTPGLWLDTVMVLVGPRDVGARLP